VAHCPKEELHLPTLTFLPSSDFVRRAECPKYRLRYSIREAEPLQTLRHFGKDRNLQMSDRVTDQVRINSNGDVVCCQVKRQAIRCSYIGVPRTVCFLLPRFIVSRESRFSLSMSETSMLSKNESSSATSYSCFFRTVEFSSDISVFTPLSTVIPRVTIIYIPYDA
jgi:hypothetical protein